MFEAEIVTIRRVPLTRSTQPDIMTELPGPNARYWIEKDEQYISRSYTRSYPSVIERGEGVTVWDVDVNRYLVFNAGIAVCSTGHCHPDVVAAIQKQAGKLIHMSGTYFYYPVQIELAELLAEIVPGIMTSGFCSRTQGRNRLSVRSSWPDMLPGGIRL